MLPSKLSLLWTLVLVSGILELARSQNDCSNGTLTISSPADVTAIASYTVYSGSIAIATSVSGSIDLDGVEEILEDLIVENVTNLTSLSSKSLRRIDRGFTINNATMLSTLSFPALTSVQTINFFALNAVSEFIFTSGLSSVSNITIEDTFLSTLDGIRLLNADNVQITNNLRLANVSLPLETAKIGITIESNGDRLVLDLSQLTSAGFISLRNVSEVSLPSLNHLSDSLLLQNSYFDIFSTGSLSVVTGDLAIHGNSALSNISFQELLSAGSLNVYDNSVLQSISLPKFGRAANITMQGKFPSIQLPALTSVNQTFNLNSTDPSFNCSAFDADQRNSVIQGDYACQGTHEKLSTLPSNSSNPTISANPTTTASPSNSLLSGAADSTSTPNSSLSGGAKAGTAVGCVVLAIGLAIPILLFIRRRQKKEPEQNKDGSIGVDGKAEMDNWEVPRKEMANGDEAHELAEYHSATEMDTNEPEENYELWGDAFTPGSGRQMEWRPVWRG